MRRLSPVDQEPLVPMINVDPNKTLDISTDFIGCETLECGHGFYQQRIFYSRKFRQRLLRQVDHSIRQLYKLALVNQVFDHRRDPFVTIG